MRHAAAPYMNEPAQNQAGGVTATAPGLVPVAYIYPRRRRGARTGTGHERASEPSRRPSFTPPPHPPLSPFFSLAFTPSPLPAHASSQILLASAASVRSPAGDTRRSRSRSIASDGVPGAASLRLRPLRPRPRPRPLLLRPHAPPRGQPLLPPSICARSAPRVFYYCFLSLGAVGPGTAPASAVGWFVACLVLIRRDDGRHVHAVCALRWICDPACHF